MGPRGLRITLGSWQSLPIPSGRCQTSLSRFHGLENAVKVHSYTAAPDIEVLTSNFPIPGYGLVPINAFVIKGSEPILVETGAAIERAEFMEALRSVIDPAARRWIWPSHTG